MIIPRKALMATESINLDKRGGAAATTTTTTSSGCHRCKECPGYSAHDWRNTCNNCKCQRSSHNMFRATSDCCAIDRIGFDPITLGPLGGSNRDNNNAPATLATSSCRARALAEIEGYSWIPTVSTYLNMPSCISTILLNKT